MHAARLQIDREAFAKHRRQSLGQRLAARRVKAAHEFEVTRKVAFAHEGCDHALFECGCAGTPAQDYVVERLNEFPRARPDSQAAARGTELC